MAALPVLTASGRLHVHGAITVHIENRRITSHLPFRVDEERTSSRRTAHATFHLRVGGAGADREFMLLGSIDAITLEPGATIVFSNSSSRWVCADAAIRQFRLSMRGATVVNLPCYLGQRLHIDGNSMPLTIRANIANYISQQQHIVLANCPSGTVQLSSARRISRTNSDVVVDDRPTPAPAATDDGSDSDGGVGGGPVRRVRVRPAPAGTEWHQSQRFLTHFILHGMQNGMSREASDVVRILGFHLFADVGQLGHNLLQPVTDDTVPEPLRRARAALDDRAARLRQLAAVKGFVRTRDLGWLDWLRGARPALVARIPAHELAHAVQCAADALGGVRVVAAAAPADAGTDAACVLCCERAPAIDICRQCHSGTVCEECTDRLVLETRAECPFCRAAMSTPSTWLTEPP